jgi:hypothetical protein
VDSASEIRELVVTNSKDVVVIIDEKLRGKGEGSRQMAERTAEVIKAAGCAHSLFVTANTNSHNT